MMKRIQIVEDDLALSNGIRMTLSGSETVFVQSGTLSDAKKDFVSFQMDAIILDINLPDGSGYEFLRWVRERSGVPVLILTANDLEMDEVLGLEQGADDYVTKPFSLAVLRARVHALLRRGQGHGAQIAIDGYRFDFELHSFEKEGEKILLSLTEQKLLRLLLENRGRLLTRDQLYERLWGDGGEYVDENALSVTINRLRGKLKDGNDGASYIQTVYGQGYIWKKKNADRGSAEKSKSRKGDTSKGSENGIDLIK